MTRQMCLITKETAEVTVWEHREAACKHREGNGFCKAGKGEQLKSPFHHAALLVPNSRLPEQ